MVDRRIVILTDGRTNPVNAKTAACVIRYKPQEVVAIADQLPHKFALLRPQSKRMPRRRANDHRHQKLLGAARRLAGRAVRCRIGFRPELNVSNIRESLTQRRRQRLLRRFERCLEWLEQDRHERQIVSQGQGATAVIVHQFNRISRNTF